MKVSCLMLTFERFEHFLRSFRCYCRQTYPEKELVIVSHGDQAYRRRLCEEIGRSGRADVRTVFLDQPLPLGALRNVAVSEAAGELVCQWDDDDMSHPNRIAAQVEALRLCAADASFLLDHLYFFSSRKALFWCDWTRARHDLGHAATLVARRQALPRYDPALSRHEDSRLQEELCLQGSRVALIKGMEHLYVYTFHGRNTFDERHHRTLTRCLGVERATILSRKNAICDAIRDHEIPPPVDVVDHLGNTVFTWSGPGDHGHLRDNDTQAYEGAVFSVRFGTAGGDGGAPWYADALGVRIERCWPFEFPSRTLHSEQHTADTAVAGVPWSCSQS